MCFIKNITFQVLVWTMKTIYFHFSCSLLLCSSKSLLTENTKIYLRLFSNFSTNEPSWDDTFISLFVLQRMQKGYITSQIQLYHVLRWVVEIT